jgi:hypothetical protein
VATAHRMARVVYRMLTLAPHASAGEYKVEYEPLSVAEYEKHYREQQIKYLEKKAAKFGFQLAPT